MRTAEIRQRWLDYFESNGHAVVPSASLISPDPSLLFTVAGMVPFIPYMTGEQEPPWPRATSVQKCIRTPDIEEVGKTTRHGTFFQMNGNFSFGDYFKEGAIQYAWDLVTGPESEGKYGFNPDDVWVTVYLDDDEAAMLWKEIAGLPEERIQRRDKKDNYWHTGQPGPGGPCSEIYIDRGPEFGKPGGPVVDEDRFLEIWNLVFMQNVQADDVVVGDLPKPQIDTGMGLERIAAVLQGVHDNYDTDTFKALIAASGELTRTDTAGELKASHRVIADHLRASGFLIADGVLPANEGRGYVLRRIMRRAMRHAHLIGAAEPLMHRLVPSLVAEMGAAYPELVRAQPLIEETLKLEETRFRQTLANGLRLLDEATGAMKPGDTLPGETAFKLYDTYGFPYDLTEDALRVQGFGVDRAGFDAAMAEQKAKARAAWKGSGAKASDDVWFDLSEEAGATEFTGYLGHDGDGQVVAIVKDGARVDKAGPGDSVILVTNQTPFYGESGGQMGDTGFVTSAKGLEADVEDTSKPLGKLHAHHATIRAGEVAVGDAVHLSVDAARRSKIRANHSATHLLHAALRRRLGDHVTQKGSLVAPDYFRFDFSHPKALTREEIEAVEADVNRHIRENVPVGTRLMSIDDAMAAGAMALFGEKYGDEVRVLSMGSDGEAAYSVELCGGTHVNALGDIQLFKITSESAVAAGVRRIEALTGEAARRYLVEREERLREAAATLKAAPDEVPARVAALVEERRRLERELAEAKKALALGGGGKAEQAGPEQVAGHGFIGQVLDGVEAKSLRGLVDEAKARVGSGVVALVAVNDGRATVAVGVTDDLAGTLSAVDLVRKAVEAVGGQGGGGRPDMAQGGGPDGARAAEALAAVKAALSAEPIAA